MKKKEKQCMATKAIMKENAKVGYMFREASDFPDDSGWRIFTGLESLDFMDVEDNIDIYDLKAIVSKDKDIEAYLDHPVGSELERVPGSSKFQNVKSE